jgi:hypothetical protein
MEVNAGISGDISSAEDLAPKSKTTNICRTEREVLSHEEHVSPEKSE